MTSIMEENLQDLKVILQKQGYVVKTKVVSGSAKYEINKIAEAENYSLVVVGAPVQSLTGSVFLGGPGVRTDLFYAKTDFSNKVNG